jgi:probable phosphoglycerate mutase
MKRATQTAQKIASNLGADLISIEDLREIGFGDWDGLSNEELFSGFLDEYAKWRGSFDVPPPNGESLKDFDARIRSIFDLILQKYPGQTLVVVAHVMPVRAFLRIANDAPFSGFWRTNIGPASISIARFWGTEAAEVVCVNSTAHLSS